MPSAIIGMGTKLSCEAGPPRRTPHSLRSRPPAKQAPHSLRSRPLALSNLRAIVELDRANYTVTVETGIDILSLKKQLRAEGCHLHVPDMKGSLGGLLASKAWLAARDIVLGMEILLPDGTVVCFGGKTMKNVAGYDLVKLMLGSWGAYGIILRATLRLYARPPHEKRPAPDKAGAGTQAPSPVLFRPNEYHRRLKKVFDPHNLFNPWIFE